jgi:hypothetical protein
MRIIHVSAIFTLIIMGVFENIIDILNNKWWFGAVIIGVEITVIIIYAAAVLWKKGQIFKYGYSRLLSVLVQAAILIWLIDSILMSKSALWLVTGDFVVSIIKITLLTLSLVLLIFDAIVLIRGIVGIRKKVIQK